MKIFKDNKEVKDATIIYDGGGNTSFVQIDGVNYDPSAFEIKEETTKKKTKVAPKTTNKEVLTSEEV